VKGVEQRLCLMGSPAIGDAEEPEPLRLRPKELALLARVSLAERPIARRQLAELIFPEADDPRGSLRWHLSTLRRKLPERLRRGLQTESDSVSMRVLTDVEMFRRGAEAVRARPGSPDDPYVLSLYRDDLCAGLVVSASPVFDTWLYVEQEGLRRLFRQATVAYARWAAEAGRQESAIPSLTKLVAVDPYFEEGHVLLIEAHEALGQAEAARSAYQLYQRIVRRELQAEPRPSLCRRYEGRSPPGPVLPREELVHLSEVTIHVVDWPGKDPPILGIHGSAGSAYSLTALGERLAPANRFIAMDLRGHGFSDKPPTGYDVAHHVDDILELIEALGLAQPVLLGFSLGGPIAAAVAARTRLRGLILLEGIITDRRFMEERAPETIVPTGESLDLRFKSIDEYLERWRAENPRYSDDAERWLDRFARFELAPLPDGTLRRRGLREALFAEVASVLEWDNLGTLARVRCPVLIVSATGPWIGGRALFTEETVEAQLRACPHAEHFVARSSNHGSLIRDPEPELLETIRRFVTSEGPGEP
jgi:pimeloyl-ACP methyl ester carboxylesterase/DNA-binding SARP family transcriptional activator